DQRYFVALSSTLSRDSTQNSIAAAILLNELYRLRCLLHGLLGLRAQHIELLRWGDRRIPGATHATAPLRLQQHIRYLHQMFQRPAFQHMVTIRRVSRQHRIIRIPEATRLGVEPEQALAALADVAKRPGLRVEMVVAGIAQDQQDRVAADVAEDIAVKLIKDPAKVAKTKQVQVGVLP